jgi:azurin
MWVALFLVCLVDIGCDQVVETNRTYYASKEKCEANAINLTKTMTKRFNEIGYNVEIGYRCDLDKSIKES